jgi:two-component system, OmpR family, sensor kinase
MMPNVPQKTKAPGCVLVCTLEGKIQEVLRDDLGLAEHAAPGKLLPTVVDRGDLGKILNFLLELRSAGSTFDWQINVPLAGQVHPVTFAGVVINDSLLVLGANNREEVMQLYEEMIKINNEQVNELRAILKDQADSARDQTKQDQVYYDEMTQLYNELANLEREVAKKNSELARLNDQKNRFIGMAAHDLRNPLHAILMYSDFLLEDLNEVLDEEHREFLTVIQGSSHLMMQLVEDFLDVSQIEAGKLLIRPGAVDLLALVNNAVMLNNLIAAKKQIELRFEPDEHQSFEIIADASKIDQVVNNLLTNAVKYSPAGSHVLIRLDPGGGGDSVLLSVQDQGPGIPADEIGQLFEPFARTSVKSSAGEKSSGLGLAIAHKIVEAHQGRLWVETEVGQGSAFYVSLPRGERS